MARCETCNVCDAPGNFTDTNDVTQVSCNVRSFANDAFTFWRCKNCHSLHCREDADLSKYYLEYPIQGHALDFWTRAAYANIFTRLIRAGLQPEMSILDYGCSMGLLVRYLAKRGFSSVNGYDAYVHEYSNKKILNKEYDCVISQDVIEHAESPQEFLAEMVRLLVPGGLLAIGTPNAAAIDLAQPKTFSLSLHPPYHRHLLSEQALLAMATKLELTPVARYHRFYYDTLWPTVNYRFLRGYIGRSGNLLNAAFEPPRVSVVLTSPVLWFHALFGYFFPPRSEMMLLFRRAS